MEHPIKGLLEAVFTGCRNDIADFVAFQILIGEGKRAAKCFVSKLNPSQRIDLDAGEAVEAFERCGLSVGILAGVP